MNKNTKKTKGKAFFRIVMFVICGAVLGVNLYMFNANSLVGNKLPMPFGYGAAVVLSGSMEPQMSKGDLIVVKETEDYTVDDIVVYQEYSSLVVHRIIDIDGENITTKGDANNAADAPVTKNQVKGKVVLTIPFIGNIVSFLKTPVGIILVIALTIFTTEASFSKEKQADDEERQKIIEEIRRLKDEK